MTVINENETDEILQDVKNAVDRIASFPVGMEPPIVFKQESIGVSITFAVTGVDDLRALKTEARRIEQDLRALEGISQVSLSGFPGEEIEVTVQADRLSELNLTIGEVGGRHPALPTSRRQGDGSKRTGRSSSCAAGFGVTMPKRWGTLYCAPMPKGAMCASQKWPKCGTDGPTTTLRAIGSMAVQLQWSRSTTSPTESILDVTELVRQYMAAYNAQAQEVGTGLQLDVIRDSSVVLNQRIDLLVNNGVVGFILVVILLALFLNIRLAFWVALAIPVSFAGMFIFAGMVGVTINVISLFGMILVIGILVDDGIVIAENIYRHYEMGKSRLEATIEGTMEVLPRCICRHHHDHGGLCILLFYRGHPRRFLRRHGRRHHAHAVV